MSKATVTRLFLGGVLAVVSGAILAGGAVWFGIANDVFVINGHDIVGITGGGLTWFLASFGFVGALTIATGMVAGLVSWIGALLNVSQLESKAWFVVLLLLGIFNFGIFGMIAYLLVGPDGTQRPTPYRAPAAAGA